MAEHSAVVGEWLADHPESRHEHGANCVYRAFKEVYGLKN
jgi:predicted SAM-dependent methyltransferase